VALVRTDVSEERITSIIRVTKICDLGTLAVTSNGSSPRSSETSVLTGATPRNIPEDGILHSHRRENDKTFKRYSCSCAYLIRHRAMKTYSCSILVLGSRWRSGISFKARPLYPPGTPPPLHTRQDVGWTPEPARKLRKKGKFLSHTEHRTPAVQPAAIPIELFGVPGESVARFTK
jgi:hypothetical protein